MSETTYYPLTQSQYLILFQMKFCVKKEISNICTEIEFLEDVDQKLLMQSLYLGMLRAPAMSVRLHTTEDKKIVQYFSDAAHEKIDYIDMSGKSDEEYEALLKKWNTAAFPNKCMETQLYNIKLLKKPNGNLAVYGCYSHLVSDAYAIMAIFKDILNIYNALKVGKALPPAPVSPLPAYEADYKYFNSEQMEADRKFFDEVVFDTEPQFTTLAGKEAKIFAKDHKSGHKYGTFAYNPLMPGAALNLPIDKDLNDKITAFALENKVSPAALYALAARTYLSAVCEVDDVTFMSPVARRATVAQKRAGGTLVMSVPIRTRFSNDITFIEGCKEVYKAQCEAYRHANFPTGMAITLPKKKFNMPQGKTFHSIGLTYQPYFTLDGDIMVKFRRLSNGRAAQPAYITIMPVDSFGNVVANYDYQPNVFTPEMLESFHKSMLGMLQEGINNPEISLNEIIKDNI